MAVRVKICGIKDRIEALEAINAGADALGFVFYGPSRRYITPEKAREITEQLPPFVNKVGVFVDESLNILRETAEYCGLDTIQLHGEEGVSYCRQIGWVVIKAFRVRNKKVLREMEAYRGVAGGFLLDTYLPGQIGGTGRTFNWDLARRAVGAGFKIVLAGGLTPQNIYDAVVAVYPYAVDVSSGVEKNGVKNSFLIKEFIINIRRAENGIT